MRDSRITGVTITGNAAPEGGGVFVTGTGVGTSELTECVIDSNTSAQTGAGAMALGDASWTDVVVSGNASEVRGGGLYLGLSSLHAVQGGELTGNTAGSWGGNLYANSGSLVGLAGTLVGQGAAPRGAGVYTNGDATVVRLIGASVQGNTAEVSGGGARLTAGRIVSESTSWGTVTPNSDDVYVNQLGPFDYGAEATFDCSLAGCIPAPN